MFVDSTKVFQAANGRWGHIFGSLGIPEINDAIERMGKGSPHTNCPVHKGENGDAFRVYNDFHQTGGMICNTCGGRNNGASALQWIKDWTYAEALKYIENALGGINSYVKPIKCNVVKKQNKASSHERKKALNFVWRTSFPLNHPGSALARRYLKGRGLEISQYPHIMRFHPSLYYRKPDGKLTRFPAIVTMATDQYGQPVTLHRIFLNPKDARKAPVDQPKKVMKYPKERVLSGGALRLFAAEETLGIAEGLETALAVHQATKMPTWACLHAAMLASFQPPKEVKKVVVWADKDKNQAGYIHALKVKERLSKEGINTIIRIPDMEIPEHCHGIDWLDVLKQRTL